VSDRPLRIGTRGSRLALWQADAVAGGLQSSGTPVEIVIIKTGGDRLQSLPLSETGTKRLFVKEIEDALLGGEIDLAVHSAKDMTAVLPDGLEIAATLPREDPSDALVLPGRHDGDLASALGRLKERPAIGTSSVRRLAQLVPVIPGARFEPIRGNVDTRLRKLDEGEYDALVLASAGLRRLGWAERIAVSLPLDVCIPAPGQGIVAIEARAGDGRARKALGPVHDAAAAAALAAERAVVAGLGGGCQLPLGAIALLVGHMLELHGIVATLDGGRVVRARVSGTVEEAAAIGARLAETLAAAGALDILGEVRQGQ
jgi:hydroxymethylbilane synthase